MGSVVLEATLDDMAVRVLAPLEVALERAGDLTELGWTVQIRDEAGDLIVPSGAARPPAATEPPGLIPDDADLPSAPGGPDAGVLRETG